MNSNNTIPLFVDLDGSLIKTDMLVESVFALLKQNPLVIFHIILWLLKGKAYLKNQIAARVEINPEMLPYNAAFLDYLRKEASGAREIILATATNSKIAHGIADHVGVFKDVIASDDTTNLSGKRKLQKINEYTHDDKFAYAGNSTKDLPVWKHADEIIVVNPESGVEKAVGKLGGASHTFKESMPSLKTYLKAIRVHQWVKNALLFLPLLAAHKANDTALLLDAFIAFIAFGFCASSVYLLNDMLDLSADRQHKTKCKRPLASGSVNPVIATLLIPALLLGSLVISLFLPIEFLLVLFGYYITTVAYSFFLKKQAIVDVLLLASLYTLRIIAGGAATSIFPSFWLLAFSMFIFLSLALVKRSAELVNLRDSDEQDVKGRGYHSSDLEYLHSMGAASGYLSVLVIALYINSENVLVFYRHPEILWMLCPLLLYWVSRIWLKTGRGEVHEDPVLFAFKDMQSRVIVLLAVAIFVTANAF